MQTVPSTAANPLQRQKNLQTKAKEFACTYTSGALVADDLNRKSSDMGDRLGPVRVSKF